MSNKEHSKCNETKNALHSTTEWLEPEHKRKIHQSNNDKEFKNNIITIF